MPHTRTFKHKLLEVTPHLRAHARYLCGGVQHADDLVQDTLLKAWSSRDSFDPDSNLRAWATTIMRNLFMSERRRDRFRGEWKEDQMQDYLSVSADQDQSIEVEEINQAMANLPLPQREALVLIAVEEFTYAEAAEICGCEIGTVKSRVSRAREILQKKMPEGLPTRTTEKAPLENSSLPPGEGKQLADDKTSNTVSLMAYAAKKQRRDK